MDMRVDILKILNDENKMSRIILYPAVETVNDPYEQTKTNSFLNPITIKAYVINLSFESLKWKYPGTVLSGSVKILCANKYENLLKAADKIKIGDDYFKVMKDDSRGWMMLKRQDHLVVILSLKND